MDLSEKVLGTTVVARLKQRRSVPVLAIGSDRFTRKQLARVDCFNFTAAQNLSAILNQHLKVPNLRHVYEHVSPAELALPRLGSVSLAVLGAAFEALGIGGDSPLESYIKKHLAKGAEMVTFDTLKHRDQKEEREHRKRERDRKHARRNTAHGLRVARFEQRRVVNA